MNFSAAVTQIEERDGAAFIRLADFCGNTDSVLSRIPDGVPGIYSWFRDYKFSEDQDLFHKELMSELESPKFHPREGAVKPYFNVTVSSGAWVSESKKKRIGRAFESPMFSKSLREVMGFSMLFQTPLYIGKTIRLRRRVSEHLDASSELRKRLNLAGIDIEKTVLLVIPTGDVSDESGKGAALEVDDPIEDADEDLYEEIFSRLFLPQFTIRLG